MRKELKGYMKKPKNGRTDSGDCDDDGEAERGRL